MTRERARGAEPGARVMTAAEMQIGRQFLALPKAWLAERVRVRLRTLERWEDGSVPVPDDVRIELARLAELTDQRVAELVEQCRASDAPVLVTFRSDAEVDGGGWPASWHRAVCGRVAREVPHVVVDFGAPPGPTEG